MMRPLGGAEMAFFVSSARVAATTEKSAGLGFFVDWSNRVMRSTCSAPRRWNTHHPANATMTMTAAVRTARELFIWLASLSSFLDSCARFAGCFAALDRLAFVVRLLSFREADGDLDASVFQVHAHRHEGHAAFDSLTYQLADL